MSPLDLKRRLRDVSNSAAVAALRKPVDPLFFNCESLQTNGARTEECALR